MRSITIASLQRSGFAADFALGPCGLLDLHRHCKAEFPRSYNGGNVVAGNSCALFFGFPTVAKNPFCLCFWRSFLVDMRRVGKPSRHILTIEYRQISQGKYPNDWLNYWRSLASLFFFLRRENQLRRQTSSFFKLLRKNTQTSSHTELQKFLSGYALTIFNISDQYPIQRFPRFPPKQDRTTFLQDTSGNERCIRICKVHSRYIA